jgi:asparagine synthase (glutamine-hydrolysing)
VEGLREIFQRSVRRRLMSDVPVGLFVSGGLDSTLVAAVAAQEAPGAERHAFSVTFEDRELDEAKYQRLAAREIGFRLHEFPIDDQVISTRMRDMILHCECAVKESFNTCILVLSEAAKSHGISVVLAGQGADELFGGYIGYRFDSLGERRNSPLQEVEQALEEELRERLWGDPNLFYEKDQIVFRDIKLALYSPQVTEMFDDVDCLSHPLVDKARLRGRPVLHQRSYLDFKLRLVDHLLSDHGDRMVMANAVEARYPFLDVELVEFAAQVPADLKVKDFTEKYLVRRMAQGLVPRQILEREKFGFWSPGSSLLLQQRIEWVQDLLSYDLIRRQGYFNADLVERLKKQYSQDGFRVHPHLDTDLLMIVLTFNLLCELFDLPSLS